MQGPRIRVVHVDDELGRNPAAFEFLHDYLRENGIDVIAEGDFEQAWHTIAQKRPHALILDIREREEIKTVRVRRGIELIEQLRADHTTARIFIAVLTSLTEELQAEAQRAGADTAFEKKTSEEQNRNILMAILRGTHRKDMTEYAVYPAPSPGAFYLAVDYGLGDALTCVKCGERLYFRMKPQEPGIRNGVFAAQLTCPKCGNQPS